MNKKEIIWREILYQSIEKKIEQFTQKELAQKFSVSLSTIFHALKAPRQLKIIEVTSRNFRIKNKEKLLYLWSTYRNLKKDIVYQTRVENLPSSKIEALMPPQIIYGLYAAYNQHFSDQPADYDKIYIYAFEKEVKKIKKRFPKKKGYPNLIVLKADDFLPSYGKITTWGQTFADLWNAEEWYAQDFLEALKSKINN
ncbi:helix-turn-helix domain-containing protein [Patescibacteria group bacterium]|nr:helix-turn-helix domain-containing protein [Patescibacteria group bacterium]